MTSSARYRKHILQIAAPNSRVARHWVLNKHYQRHCKLQQLQFLSMFLMQPEQREINWPTLVGKLFKVSLPWGHLQAVMFHLCLTLCPNYVISNKYCLYLRFKKYILWYFLNHRLCATVSSCNVVHAPVHENRSTWGTPSSKNPLNEVCYPCYAVCVKPIITYGFESTKQGGNLMFAAHCPTQRAAFITDIILHIPAI